jgi:diguanylate cyclase (GGDEF)-like protein
MQEDGRRGVRFVDQDLRLSSMKSIDEVERLVRKLDRERKARLEAERIAEIATRSALHDNLTGLANRAMLDDILKTSIARSRRNHRAIGILFLDLDRFKNINDSLGHKVGDLVLKEAARRITRAIRSVDSAARIGGDEFAVVCEGAGGIREIVVVAQRILDSFADTFICEEKEISIEPSIGVVLSTEESTPAELLRDADAAMYQAKNKGGRCFEIFDAAMREVATQRLALESSLRAGLRTHQFTAEFQPVVCVPSGNVRSFEALARWNHPELGAISPELFIRIAEDSHQIEELGEQILGIALRDFSGWLHRREGPSDGDLPILSVNFSPAQLGRPTIVPRTLEAIDEMGLAPDRVAIEITESTLMVEDDVVAANLKQFSDKGLRLDLDDFGTGYSSLAYLKRFHVDVLKIDRMFVRDIETDLESRAIVEAIVKMSSALNIDVIAEGVETEPQVQILGGLGCRWMQGYYFDRPAKLDALKHHYATEISADAVVCKKSAELKH